MSLQRKRLGDLNCRTTNALVIAMVIAKSEAHIFRDRYANHFRGVTAFTVRDSKHHICNCKYWGSMAGIQRQEAILRIGAIIEIQRPRVMPNGQSGSHERFCPPATLPYTLVVNEGSGELLTHQLSAGENHGAQMAGLLRQPHKDVRRCQRIVDVIELDPRAADTPLVDIFVAIALKRPPRDAPQRGPVAREQRCLELVVFDESFMAGVVLTVWNSAWIDRALNAWRPLHTCLFLTAIKFTYSSFYGGTIFNLTKRTLVYENPSGPNLNNLRRAIGIWPPQQWQQTAQLCFGKCVTNYCPVLPPAVSQLNIAEVYARITQHVYDHGGTFTALVMAKVSRFDLDGPTSVVSFRCKFCGSYLNAGMWCTRCHINCTENFFARFNINVQLTDHTGTLLMSRLHGANAENVLGMSVYEFMNINQAQKELIKWRFLMHHVECKLLVRKNGGIRNTTAVIILTMRLLNNSDVGYNMDEQAAIMYYQHQQQHGLLPEQQPDQEQDQENDADEYLNDDDYAVQVDYLQIQKF